MERQLESNYQDGKITKQGWQGQATMQANYAEVWSQVSISEPMNKVLKSHGGFVHGRARL